AVPCAGCSRAPFWFFPPDIPILSDALILSPSHAQGGLLWAVLAASPSPCNGMRRLSALPALRVQGAASACLSGRHQAAMVAAPKAKGEPNVFTQEIRCPSGDHQPHRRCPRNSRRMHTALDQG